ncbi:MAG: sulfatase-like hydrolase/transferase [Acidobacteriota bacterium]
MPIGETSSAEVLKDNGYATGCVGKWHLDGPDRQGFTPPGPRRQGFDYWAAANICHNYTKAFYYRDTPQRIEITGYQPDHETDLAIQYIEDHRKAPFLLNLHWGPPRGWTCVEDCCLRGLTGIRDAKASLTRTTLGLVSDLRTG